MSGRVSTDGHANLHVHDIVNVAVSVNIGGVAGSKEHNFPALTLDRIFR